MLRIIILEDHVRLLRHLVDFLGHFPEDFEVTATTRHDEATQLLSSQGYDVLLTDLDLVGTDSTVWLHEAMEIAPRLKVVAMTAFSTPEIRNKIAEEGAVGFFEKPFDIEDLRKALLELAGRNYWDAARGGVVDG